MTAIIFVFIYGLLVAAVFLTLGIVAGYWLHSNERRIRSYNASLTKTPNRLINALKSADTLQEKIDAEKEIEQFWKLRGGLYD